MKKIIKSLFIRKSPLAIRGIQRSGTNFLESILNDLGVKPMNYEILKRSSEAHKHFRIQDDKKTIIMDKEYMNNTYISSVEILNSLAFNNTNIKNIVIFKDPINWLYSIARWAERCGWLDDNQNLFENKKLLLAYLAEWDNFYCKWEKLNKKQNNLIMMIQWEQLCASFNENIEKIKLFLNFKLKNNVLKIQNFKNINLSEKSKIQLKNDLVDKHIKDLVYKNVNFKDFKKIY